MKNCKKIRKNMAAFWAGEAKGLEEKPFRAHLAECEACRKEWEEYARLSRAKQTFEQDIAETMASVDWDELSSKILDRAREAEGGDARRVRPSGWARFLLQPRFRPVAAGLVIGLFLGSLVTFLVLRNTRVSVAENGRIVVPEGFYEKMELEMARREAIDYLEKSQYLLLDFVQSTPEKPATSWREGYASERVRQLLAKKKYIDPHLAAYRLAKAKALCDQIELLFLELIQISDDLPEEELQRIREMIQEKQILLKIKLVRKELGKSEV